MSLSETEADGSETLSAVTATPLLMLTGCQLCEIQTLRWEDVNLKAAKIGFRYGKTGARIVPLSGAAVNVLSALPRPEDNPWVIVARKPGAHQRAIPITLCGWMDMSVCGMPSTGSA